MRADNHQHEYNMITYNVTVLRK